MGVLRVSKKAVSLADAEEVLEASRKFEYPFGERVHYVANEDFYTEKSKVVRTLSNIFKKAAEEKTGNKIPPHAHFDNFILEHEELIARSQEPDNFGAFKYIIGVDLTTNVESLRISAQFAVGLPANDSLKSYGLNYVEDEDDTPLNSKKIQFFAIWHEYAHLTGCKEPQADMIAALMCRQNFEDTAILELIADSRIIKTLCGHEDVLNKYGWQTTQALDYVIGLDQDTIDSLNEFNMWEVAEMDFDNQKTASATALYHLINKYEETYDETATTVSVSKMIPVCEALIDETNFEENSANEAFLRRLLLAMKRVKKHISPITEQDLNAAKDRKTFISEIPESLIPIGERLSLPVPSDLSPGQ